MSIPNIAFPSKLAFLFRPKRYKVLWGGRGASKSWGIARALLIKAASSKLRILCAREIQKSIADSVHHLLETQIPDLGLSDFYRVEKAGIYGRNGSEIIFTGLRDAANLKSYEAIDIVWIEEAQNVSRRSWDILIPTIRRDGSEIWVSFNPELETDETYQRFVVNPPPDSATIKINYDDNPWFPDVLRREMEHCRLTRPDDYLNIWQGHCKQVLDGAIYADEIRSLTAAGRITSVPYDPAKPVHTFWDLGIADQTAIWFVQAIAFEFRFIDFLQDRNKAIPHYLTELQNKRYVYGFHYLPHDGQRRDLGTGKSIENHITTAGHKVKIVPNIGVSNGLNAARLLFARAWFDQAKCADGLNCLRRYRWKKHPDTGIYSREPLHDDNSNGSDAYRYAAVGLTEPEVKKAAVQRQRMAQVSTWS